MLIPRILRNDVPYINTNHSRDFIHVDDLVRAIDTLIKSNLRGVTDIGSGTTNNLVELIEYFGIDCERVVGEQNERLDNLADNTLLNKIGWSPKINLYDYIKENEMITEEYLKEHFVTAHFIDNERQNIEILMTSEDKKQRLYICYTI